MKYCYTVVHEGGHIGHYGEDAAETKRIAVPGLPEALKIIREDGTESTYTLGAKSRFYVIPNAQRIRAGLSLRNWVKNCETDFKRNDDSRTISQIVIGLM